MLESAKNEVYECYIKLYFNKTEYIRPVVERNNTQCLTMALICVGGHVLVLGCIKSDLRIKLVDEKLNSENYISWLWSNLLIDWEDKELFSAWLCSLLQITFLVREYVQILKDEPTQSPDLIIIGSLWWKLKKQVHQRKPRYL